MTKLSSAFGEKYQAKRKDLLTRSFVLNGHTFKVRIPLVIESDAIYKKVSNPDDETIEKIYQEITAPLRTGKRGETNRLVEKPMPSRNDFQRAYPRNN